jgi:protein-S-isoprenylcysteine O-methyltransferase Ste14
LIGLSAGYLPPYTDRKAFWTLDGDTIRRLGVVLFAAGGALRLWPVFVLGRRFSGSVAVQPGGCSQPSSHYSLRSAKEKLLRRQFGGEYDAYCNRTSRLLPGLY